MNDLDSFMVLARVMITDESHAVTVRLIHTLSSTDTVPPSKINFIAASIKRFFRGKAFTLQKAINALVRHIPNSPRRVQVADLGSDNRKPAYVGRSHIATVGLIIFLHMTTSVVFFLVWQFFLAICQCVSSMKSFKIFLDRHYQKH